MAESSGKSRSNHMEKFPVLLSHLFEYSDYFSMGENGVKKRKDVCRIWCKVHPHHISFSLHVWPKNFNIVSHQIIQFPSWQRHISHTTFLKSFTNVIPFSKKGPILHRDSISFHLSHRPRLSDMCHFCVVKVTLLGRKVSLLLHKK